MILSLDEADPLSFVDPSRVDVDQDERSCQRNVKLEVP